MKILIFVWLIALTIGLVYLYKDAMRISKLNKFDESSYYKSNMPMIEANRKPNG